MSGHDGRYHSDEYVGGHSSSQHPHASGVGAQHAGGEYEEDDDVGGLFGAGDEGEENIEDDGHDYALGTGNVVGGLARFDSTQLRHVDDGTAAFAAHTAENPLEDDDGDNEHYYHESANNADNNVDDEDDELLNEAFRQHTAPDAGASPSADTKNHTSATDHHNDDADDDDEYDYDERHRDQSPTDNDEDNKRHRRRLPDDSTSRQSTEDNEVAESGTARNGSSAAENNLSGAPDAKKRKISETSDPNNNVKIPGEQQQQSAGTGGSGGMAKHSSIPQKNAAVANKKRRIVTHNTVANYYTRLPQAFVQRADLRRLKHLMMRQRRHRGDESTVWDLVMHSVSEQVEASKRKLDMRQNDADIWAAQYDGGVRLLAKHEKLRACNDALAAKLDREKVGEALESRAKWTDALGKLVTATSVVKSDHKTFVVEQQTLSHVIHALSREACRDFERVQARQRALVTLRQMATTTATAPAAIAEKFDTIIGALASQIEPFRMQFNQVIHSCMPTATASNSAALAEFDNSSKFIPPYLDRTQRQKKILETLYADEPIIAHRIMQIEHENLAAKNTNLPSFSSRNAVEQMAKALSTLMPAPPRCLLYAQDDDDGQDLDNKTDGASSLPPEQFMDSLLLRHQLELERQHLLLSSSDDNEPRDIGEGTNTASAARKTIGKFISDSLDADVVRLNSFVARDMATVYHASLAT